MSSGKRTLKVEILSYWHSGAGRGDGAALDAVVLTDDFGLPYLPGKHIKGLLRDACTRLEALDALPERGAAQTWTSSLFGTASPVGGTRLQSTRGRLRIDSATLGAQWLNYAQDLKRTRGTRHALDHLFPQIAATAMEGGVAKNKSLRTQQVTVPMTLTANLQGELDAQAWEVLATVAQAIKAVGKHRTRGLGRARLTLLDEKEA